MMNFYTVFILECRRSLGFCAVTVQMIIALCYSGEGLCCVGFRVGKENLGKTKKIKEECEALALFSVSCSRKVGCISLLNLFDQVSL